jgi:hypothetical protein
MTEPPTRAGLPDTKMPAANFATLTGSLKCTDAGDCERENQP